MANSYLNEYSTIAEMNAAYEEGHDESWVAYCAEDNSLYYQQKTKIASKYFDNLEYNSENKTLEFYIDGDLKKSIEFPLGGLKKTVTIQEKKRMNC